MLLAFVMVFGMLPTFAFAEEEHVHTWGEWTVSAAPTCTAQGQKIRSCADCGEVETTAISPNGHSWSDWTVTAYPSCIETGSRMHNCTVCGEVETETIPANGHTWSDWTVTVGPTCTEAGEKVRSCSACGTVETEAVPALGHSFGDWQTTSDPDCTTAGSKERICSVCNEKETEAIPALGHSFGDWQITAEPDCTDAGSKERICSACNEKETEAIPALGHSFGDWQTTAEPDCVNAGSKERICSACGEKETEAIDALGHDWGEWEIVTEATCDEDGEKIHTCSVCEVTEIEVIPAAHKWGEWEIVTEPTCTEEGEQVRVCEVCEESETEKIPALGHKWDVEDEDEESTCTVCGEHREAKYNIVIDGQRWCKLNEEDGNIETAEDWAAMFYSYYPTGDWAKDLLTIASSQLGYKGVNLINKNGDVVNYSRYGHWYGMPFGSWCAMFISFCLHYAQVPTSAMPIAASCESWVSSLSGSGKYASAGTYSPKPGDLIFFDYFPYDNIADHVGIVNSFNEENGLLVTIEGATNNIVKIHRYNISDRDILGFGIMPENPALIVAEPEIITETIERFDHSIFGKVNGRTVTVSGMLPADASLQIVAIPSDAAKSILTAQGGSENAEVVCAFDISIISGGEKYDLEEYGDSITVSVSGISAEEPVTVTHVKIDVTNENGGLDSDKLNIAQTTSIESETLATGTKDNSVFFDLSSCSVSILTIQGSGDDDESESTRDGEGGSTDIDWPQDLIDLAESYYGENATDPKPTLDFEIGDPVPSGADVLIADGHVKFPVSYYYAVSQNWTGYPYNPNQTLFDIYKNVKLTIKAPAGLLLTYAFGKDAEITENGGDNAENPNLPHTYVVTLGNIDMKKQGHDNIEFYIGNNGTTEAVHTFTAADLAQLLKIEADIDILDKTLPSTAPNYVVDTIHLSDTVPGKGFSITSNDVWSVKKEKQSEPVVGVSSDNKTVTFKWTVGVGLKSGEDLIRNQDNYVYKGRDGVTSLTLEEALTSAFLINGEGTDPRELIGLEIKKGTAADTGATGEYIDIKTNPSVPIWGAGASNSLKMDSAVILDSNGQTPPEVETPVYTQYTIKATYKLNSNDIVDFYSTVSHALKSKNTVTLKQTFAHRTVSDEHADNEITAPLTANKPASFKITKFLLPYKSAQKAYENEYGVITYTVKDSNGYIPDIYELKENGTYSLLDGPILPNTVYYLEPGVYTVTEAIDPDHATDMVFDSVTPHADGDPSGTARFTGVANTDPKEITFKNKEHRGDIEILKNDDRGNALKGATFRLTLPDGVTIEGMQEDPETHKHYIEATSDDNGKLSFTNLPYGTYSLDETAVPSGYAKDPSETWPKSITVADGFGTGDTPQILKYTFKNIQTMIKVDLTKWYGTANPDPTTFSKLSGNTYVNAAYFTLQRRVKLSETEYSEWVDVDEDYFGATLSTELKVGSSTGMITDIWVPASVDNKPYQYRFKETITNGHATNPNFYFYPVVENADGTFSNKPNDTEAYSLPVTAQEGVDISFNMYNRRTVRVTVQKNHYDYKDASGGTNAVNKLSEFTLYYYKGSGSPSSPSDLTPYPTSTAYPNPAQAGKAEGATSTTNAAWWFLPLYDGTDRYTYYIKETDPADGYVWSARNDGSGKVVTIGTETYVKIDIPDNTTSTGFSTLQYNYRDMTQVQLIKRNYMFQEQGVSGCTVSIFTNEAMTDYATDLLSGEQLKDVPLPGGKSSLYVYLEHGHLYYFKEKAAAGYSFVSCTGQVSGQEYGIIDLTGTKQPTNPYYIDNTPDTEVYIKKKDATGTHSNVSGAQFTVYQRTPNGDGTYTYTQVQYDGSPLVITKTNERCEVRLPQGEYWLCETSVPNNYLDPNTAAAAAEYNRLDSSNTYVYDPGTEQTYVKMDVPAPTTENNAYAEFTFYNIPTSATVKVVKYIDGAFKDIDGFGIVINKPDGTQAAAPKKTDDGVVTFTLPVYDADGNKITYTVNETDTSGWTGGAAGDLANTYYKSMDELTFQLEPGKVTETTNTEGQTDTTLRVENESYIKITALKERFDGWQLSHGGDYFPMEGVTVGLYRRIWTADNSNPWVWQRSIKTDGSGEIDFSKLERTGIDETTGATVYYEYALVELKSDDPTYFPYQDDDGNPNTDNFNVFPANTDDLTDLTPYNALTLLKSQIVADKEYDLTNMLNSNHWVQFKVTKWLDQHPRFSGYVDGVFHKGNRAPAGTDYENYGIGDPDTGHRMWPADENNPAPGSPDSLLDDCVFSLYRCVISASDTSVTFSRSSPWELVGTYTSGALLDPDGNPYPGVFMTDVDSGINDNYVYVLVEDNVGPNAVEINPYYEYTFWYAETHSPVTCTGPNGTIVHSFTYTMDDVNDTSVLDSWQLGDDGKSNILLASLRLSKWYDEYDSNGNRKHEYKPLNNVTFQVKLMDGTVIADMTTGLDGNTNVAFAQSGTYQLVFGTGDNAGKVYLREYEVPNANGNTQYKQYEVSVIELSDPDHLSYKIYGIEVEVVETGAPEGYGFISSGYQTYLVFVDKAPGTMNNKFRFYSDLYFVKAPEDDPAHPVIHLAEDQEGRLWHVTEAATNPVVMGDDLQRIVDYPMKNIPVTILKYGYEPKASTVALAADLAAADTGDKYSEELAKGDYGATALPYVVMKLQRKTDAGGWEDWDYLENKPGTTTFNTNPSGMYFFQNGLKMNSYYRIKETGFLEDAPDKDKYELTYNGANDSRYRYFYVGGEAVTVYMANPEKLDLTIRKLNILDDSPVSGLKFKLNNLTATETPKNSGTYVFTDIPTDKYVLTETGGSLSTKYFKEWFIATYGSDYSALVTAGQGMTIGYTYTISGAASDKNRDVAITQIADLNGLGDPIIVKNPVKSSLELLKFDITDEEFKTELSTAKFYYFRYDFKQAAFTTTGMSVTIPTVTVSDISDPNTAEETVKSKFSGWTYIGTANSSVEITGLEPGVYAFVEYSTPEGYSVLASGDNVVIYTAVLTGGLDVKVTGIPENVTVGDYTVITAHSGNNDALVTINARDPKMAYLKATKTVEENDLGTPRTWTVTLKLYDSDAEDATELASAVITKPGANAVVFKKGTATQYFPVGTELYLEETVTSSGSNSVDNDHFVPILVKIGGEEVDPEESGRYKFTVGGSGEISVEVTNRYLYGRVDFWKFDMAKQNALHKAKFSVYHEVEKNGTKVWEVIPGSTVYEIGNTGAYRADFPLDSATPTTYHIIETQAPEGGYVINPNKDYIEVELPGEPTDPDDHTFHNYLNLAPTDPDEISALDEGTYFTDPKGNLIKVTKYGSVYQGGGAKVGEEDVTFGLYRWNGSYNADNEWVGEVDADGNPICSLLVEKASDSDGLIDFNYLLSPNQWYAIAEIGYDHDKFSGIDSIVIDGAPVELKTIAVGNRLYTGAYVFKNDKQDDSTFMFDAYNIPNIEPVIRKLDVGQYPEGAKPTMEFKVFELPEGYDLDSINDTTAAEIGATTNTTDTTKPRIVFSGDTATGTAITVQVEGIEGDVLGTTLKWHTETISDRWNPARNYLLVETKIGALNAEYSTLVKDDPADRVEWYKVIPAGVDPTNADAFTLKNINSVANVTLTKTAIEHSDVEGAVASDIVRGKVESLMMGDRKVAYSIKPVVTGSNQMLTSFIVEEQGMEFKPVDGWFDYKIDQILIGRASQKGPEGATISATVTFYKADGSTQVGEAKTIPDVTVIPADNSDPDNPVSADKTPVTYPYNIPEEARRFKISYFSQAVMDLSETDSYVLGENFEVEPTIVAMTVKQTPDGTVEKVNGETVTHPATEITEFTNFAHTELHYLQWNDTGTTCKDPDRKADASSVVFVDGIELPKISLTKGMTPEDATKVSTGSLVKYVLTVTNTSPADSGLIFHDPVLLDILPTGVKFKQDDGLYKVKVDPTTFGIETVPVTGVVVPRSNQNIETEDAETAVIFKLSGDLAPQASVTVTFCAIVADSAIQYQLPDSDEVSIQNDAYLSSAVHGKHTKANPMGYSFMFATTEGGDYVFGKDLATTAASVNGVAATHEEGVHGALTSSSSQINNYTDDFYGWTHAMHDIPVVKADFLTTFKSVRGNKDPGFHEGLGVASRTTGYLDNSVGENPLPDQLPPDWERREGWVDWKLTINNGDAEEAATGLVIGDVMPKVGDIANRSSAWDVVFKNITSVKFNGIEQTSDKYTMWYYTGGIAGADTALREAMPLSITWTDAEHGAGWISQTELDRDHDTMASKEGITAFMMVMHEGVVLNPKNSAVITYRTVPKAVPDDGMFSNIAFENASNEFYISHDTHRKPTPCETVSVTLMDKDVPLEGDVWIDEDWDATQESENRRDYLQYAIINKLIGSRTADDPGISFMIHDARQNSLGEFSEDAGTTQNVNPGYGESIRHFRFSELGASKLWVENAEYIVSDQAFILDPNWILNPASLKGEDPYYYWLKSSLGDSSLKDIFKLTDLGTEHYMSDDPDTLTEAGHSLDNNFYGDGGNETAFRTHPFYVRYSDRVDQSKDIGFKMYRELEILKVAMDTLNLETPMPIEGAQFEVYGYYEDSALKGDHVFGSGTLLTFIEKSVGEYEMIFNYNEATFDTSVLSEGEKVTTILTTGSDGKIHITGLNWWKEYDIKETSATDGFSIAGATATGDSSVGTEIVDHGDGKFTLKVPNKGKTNILDKVTVANPRGIPFEFEKIGEVNGSDTTVPLYGIEFSLFLDKDCTIPATDGVDENGQPKQIKAVSEKVTDEAGKDHAIVHFDMLRFAYGDPDDPDSYFPGIYYMKETSLGANTLYWDNSTVYKLEVKPQSGNIAPHVEVTVVEASTGTGSTGSTGGTGETGGTGNTGTSGTADDSGVTTTARTGMLSKSEVGFEYTILNELKKYRISLVKKDGKDNTTPIVGAEFDLYDKMPPASSGGSAGTSTGGDQDAKKIPVEAKAVAEMKIPLDAKAITAVKLPADARADAAATRDGTEPVVPILTGLKTIEGGKLDLGVLVPGTYYLVETKAPVDYIILNEPVMIEIAEEGTVTVTYKRLTIDPDTGEFTWTLTTQDLDLPDDFPDKVNTEPQELTPIEFEVFDYPKYGDLRIKKKLNKFELSEDATFVFTVYGEFDPDGDGVKETYSNVAVLTISAEHPTGELSTVLHHIPAGMPITVTEEYSGSHYTLVSDPTQTTVIVASSTVTVNFTNDYNEEEKGGHGIVNTFDPDDSDLGWHWGGPDVGSTPDDPQLPDYPGPPPEPTTGDEAKGGKGREDDTGNGNGTGSGGGTPGGGDQK